LFGLDDRGVLSPDMKADINVIDFDGEATGALAGRIVRSR
jgi:N-acyl-D-aspartate/D-glutamate deacylase